MLRRGVLDVYWNGRSEGWRKIRGSPNQVRLAFGILPSAYSFAPPVAWPYMCIVQEYTEVVLPSVGGCDSTPFPDGNSYFV